ncbi:MAG: GntR family transcriptional regulator [Silvania sp.]|uniref:GntR family transcriptional regulator n=1 Tax=Silvania hatchlandensis TaxID=2926469 RepID=A0A9J6PXQ3_9ENTR|nr:GntR family transcriptional regulator [Silvania hatchlandensis]MCU6663428.1 GntR family transcriptional regulator [Silvania hatchlandensis]
MLDLDNIEKAQRMSLTTQVEVALKGALISGSLRPGERLVTKEIADKLGTSITPVREALLRLVSAGALHAAPAQAFLVPEVTQVRYNEVNKIRRELEMLAVASACEKMTDSQLAEVRRLCEDFHDAMSNGEADRALQTNRIFRFKLYQYAEMPTLSALIEQLWMRIGPCFSYYYDRDIDLPVSVYRYDELLSALEARDVERSRAAVADMVDKANNLLVQQYLR